MSIISTPGTTVSRTQNHDTAVTHTLARLLYWSSIIILLVGIRYLIDPSHRKIGTTLHIYITLVAFESYMWLLLLLGRWQFRQQLFSDTLRTSLFVIGLSALMFIALNELYWAGGMEAYLFSAVILGLTIIRLHTARRWFNLHLPRPFMAAVYVWVVLLACPAPILKALIPRVLPQHYMAYILCWVAAVVCALHLPLVSWQRKKGFSQEKILISHWIIPWVILLSLAAVATCQLYASFWGFSVKWAQWYFSPLFLGVGIVVFCVSQVRGNPAGWSVLALSVGHAVVAAFDDLPRVLAGELSGGLSRLLWHSYYPVGLYAVVMLLVAWYLLRWWWLLGLALLGPFVALMAKLSYAVWYWRYGKGLALVLGSFLLLGLGALLQYWQQRWGPSHPRPLTPWPPTGTDPAYNHGQPQPPSEVIPPEPPRAASSLTGVENGQPLSEPEPLAHAPPEVKTSGLAILALIFSILPFTCLIGFALAMSALIVIPLYHGRLKGYKYVLASVLLSMFWFAIMSFC